MPRPIGSRSMCRCDGQRGSASSPAVGCRCTLSSRVSQAARTKNRRDSRRPAQPVLADHRLGPLLLAGEVGLVDAADQVARQPAVDDGDERRRRLEVEVRRQVHLAERGLVPPHLGPRRAGAGRAEQVDQPGPVGGVVPADLDVRSCPKTARTGSLIRVVPCTAASAARRSVSGRPRDITGVCRAAVRRSQASGRQVGAARDRLAGQLRRRREHVGHGGAVAGPLRARVRSGRPSARPRRCRRR